MKEKLIKLKLPIQEIIPEVIASLEINNKLILTSPPGSGKSTLVPIYLLDLLASSRKKILMLEPRRIAAKSLATYMSSLISESVGSTIGYKIRFDNCISEKTKIEIVTEGILTRMLQNDNALEEYEIIIFDEFHERNIHSDVGLSFCLQIQEFLRPDLKLVIMSATLDSKGLSEQLNAPIIVSDGQLYPVEIEYVGCQDKYMISELAADVIVNAVHNHEGDILVFFPGQSEILRCKDHLKSLKEFDILPLYGNLPFSQQQRVLRKSTSSKRRIILATSIAETSLTIEGIKIVVDTGLGRISKFDAKTNLSKLETIQISKDSADQRAGRAGRLSAGICYRMWTISDHQKSDDHRIPEIAQADLTSLSLDLLKWGITDFEELFWITKPDTFKIEKAQEFLEDINAVNEDLKLTSHGNNIHQLPCHPRIAHMLIEAKQEGLASLACDLAAILESKDPMIKENSTDINIRLEKLRLFRKEGRLSNQWARIEKLSSYYRRLIKTEESNDLFDIYETGLLLVFAFPERIAYAKPGNNAQFQLANGKQASIHHKDDLAFESWLAIASLTDRDKVGKIFLASPLNPSDLKSHIKELDIVKWDFKEGVLIAKKELRIGSIILRSLPLTDVNQEQVTEALINAIKKNPEQLLDINEELIQLLARLNSLSVWNKDSEWSPISLDQIISNCEEWLSPYLNSIKDAKQLKKLNISNIYFDSLEFNMQKKINKLAPLKQEVPSGSSIRIKYNLNGEQPILEVRLQEVFGLLSSPCINNGATPILLHLLSPGYKLVQITGDLSSFWSDAYFYVRKDMKGKYPKHEWPEKPLEAKAIRGVKRKK